MALNTHIGITRFSSEGAPLLSSHPASVAMLPRVAVAIGLGAAGLWGTSSPSSSPIVHVCSSPFPCENESGADASWNPEGQYTSPECQQHPWCLTCPAGPTGPHRTPQDLTGPHTPHRTPHAPQAPQEPTRPTGPTRPHMPHTPHRTPQAPHAPQAPTRPTGPKASTSGQGPLLLHQLHLPYPGPPDPPGP